VMIVHGWAKAAFEAAAKTAIELISVRRPSLSTANSLDIKPTRDASFRSA
jgi:hypothetical protein